MQQTTDLEDAFQRLADMLAESGEARSTQTSPQDDAADQTLELRAQLASELRVLQRVPPLTPAAVIRVERSVIAFADALAALDERPALHRGLREAAARARPGSAGGDGRSVDDPELPAIERRIERLVAGERSGGREISRAGGAVAGLAYAAALTEGPGDGAERSDFDPVPPDDIHAPGLPSGPVSPGVLKGVAVDPDYMRCIEQYGPLLERRLRDRPEAGRALDDLLQEEERIWPALIAIAFVVGYVYGRADQ